jgi:hypothetical protein
VSGAGPGIALTGADLLALLLDRDDPAPAVAVPVDGIPRRCRLDVGGGAGDGGATLSMAVQDTAGSSGDTNALSEPGPLGSGEMSMVSPASPTRNALALSNYDVTASGPLPSSDQL